MFMGNGLKDFSGKKKMLGNLYILFILHNSHEPSEDSSCNKDFKPDSAGVLSGINFLLYNKFLKILSVS